MNNNLYYFAFGSNMNYYRLHQRIGDFESLGMAVLPAHQLVFHKCGGDGSGKCTVISSVSNDVWGIVVAIDEKQKLKLDYYEGVGHGYSAVYHDIKHQDKKLNALLYQADLNAMDDGLLPFNWYKAFVLSGAKQQNLPDDYIKMIELIQSIDDPDQSRSEKNLQILSGVY